MPAGTRPRTRRTGSRIALAVLATLTSVALTTLPSSAAQPDTAVAGHLTGTLADGATWIADVPAGWGGTLILYSHGFGTLTAADAPNAATRQALLDRGYALAGSSYNPNGSLWALADATRDQFASLAAVERVVGRPRTTIALGTSMGGLISAQEAERAGRRLDAVVSTCGLLGGGIDLNNYQLDGEHALARTSRSSGTRARPTAPPPRPGSPTWPPPPAARRPGVPGSRSARPC
jgi:pimeloyl-ACP methyl ester carboxylesterase